jgi:hypothetical protein
MKKRNLLPVLILMAMLVGCTPVLPITTPPVTTPFATSTPANPTPVHSSGIEGHVTEGPMCPGPVPVGNNPCPDQPYQATISILDADNKEIAQVQTDVDGYFKIPLPPGTYILHPIATKPLPRASDQTVVVTPDQFTQITIMYDSGMR